jgi:DNA invertase Pin-like site-specific DNA recombinase
MSKTLNSQPTHDDVADLFASIKARTHIESNRLGGRRTRAQEEMIKQNSISFRETNFRKVDQSLDPIAIGQIRLSKSRKESVSVERQNEQLVEFAKQYGCDLNPDTNPLAFVFPEHQGASKNKVRPEFDRLIKFIEEYDGERPIHLFTYMLDRFTRLEEVWNRVLPILRERNVHLHIWQSPFLDIHDRNHDWGFTSLIRNAEGEATSLKQRSRDAHKRRAEEAYFRGGPAPLGHKRVIQEGEIHPTLVRNDDPTDYLPGGVSEAEFLNQIYDKIIEGHSTAAVARWINSHNVPSRRNSKNGWDCRTVTQMIRNARNAGFQTHKAGQQNWSRFNEDHIVKDKAGNPIVAFEAVVTPEKFYAAIAALDKKYIKRRKHNSSRLAGLVVCTSCNNRMVAGTGGNGKGGRYTKYRCYYRTIGTCPGNNSIAMPGLETVIFKLIRGLKSDPSKVASVLAAIDAEPTSNPERDELVDAIAAKEAELPNADKYTAVAIRATIKAMQDDLDRLSGQLHNKRVVAKQLVNEFAVFEQAWNDDSGRVGLNNAINAWVREIRVHPVKPGDVVMNRYELAKRGWHVNYERVDIVMQDGTVIDLDADWAKHITPLEAA